MADAPVILPAWLAAKKKRDTEIYRAYFFLMKELNLSYDDINQMPIPAILQLMEELGEHGKEQERQAKKQRK